MSKRNTNSDNDLRDEYNFDELEIAKVGKGWKRKIAWAVCVTSNAENLVPLKLYKVEFYPGLAKAKILDDNGKAIFYPQEWFLSVEFAETVSNVLEKVV